jgi:hypothetical protein
VYRMDRKFLQCQNMQTGGKREERPGNPTTPLELPDHIAGTTVSRASR